MRHPALCTRIYTPAMRIQVAFAVLILALSSSFAASQQATDHKPATVAEAQAFVDRWRPRVEAITNARHRIMLRVILGETLEQKRLFDQALAGRTDMLGRRTAEVGPVQGEVLPARWIE